MAYLGTRAGDQTPFGVRKQEGSLQIGRLDAIQKEVHESGSDTEDLAVNCIDRLFDFVTNVGKFEDDGTLKEIYIRSSFYEVFTNFNFQ